MAGLAPSNIRLPANDDLGPELPEIIVEAANEDDETPEFSDDGAIVRIEHGDGSVTVSLDGRPLADAPDRHKGAWFDNLVEDIDQMELGRISEDLLRGIDDDLSSRDEWIQTRATGIVLLGLKIEVPGVQGASDGAPVEGMSKVRHPQLLEAVLRFQANARAELLPTDGPVKVRDDGDGSTAEHDQLGDALEQDMNHYLTAVDKSYYPDTDRMLLMLGFGGTSFKKVYKCPLRMRPVSESVDASDLIVNNEATDLSNAKRITHRVKMRMSTVRRMQLLGVYRDVELSTPLPANVDAVQRAKLEQQGVSADTNNPEDRDREIYECYCELEIKGFEHRYKGKPSGLEIPYRVTIDVSSRQILSIVRNYDEGDDLPQARKTFVKYTFVPGMGFYDIGLLHILGNTTNALTAGWREMLDNGMYANFPGFLIADSAGRQNTNIFRIPPGGGAPVKTGGMPIRDAVMPLPYKTEGMAALMTLLESMSQTGQRIGGTSELQTGEGRADAPVGTTLALIEQATKILNSVHKRMHASQAEEFQLLVECFRENPETFWERGCKSKTPWSVETFMKALDDCDLVPQADPNTASHAQRVTKVQALNLWAQANPSLADPIAIGRVSLTAMGWSNPQQFMAPPESMGQPPPELIEMNAGIATAKQLADAKTADSQAGMIKAQSDARKTDAEITAGLGAQQQTDTPVDHMQAQSKLMDSETKQQELGLRLHETQLEDTNRDADRASKEHLEMLKIAEQILREPADAEAGAKKVGKIERQIGAKTKP